MKKRFMFECEDGQLDIIKSMMKSEFGIEIAEFRSRRNSRFAEPVGPGFGDKLWRVNYELNRIEASFGKPCFQSKALKTADFKWDHAAGLWYADNTEHYAEVCRLLKLVQTDSVAKK